MSAKPSPLGHDHPKAGILRPMSILPPHAGNANPREVRRAPLVWPAALLLLLGTPGGCVTQRCYDSRDCPSSQICSVGACIVPECDLDHPCGAGFACVDNHCMPTTSIQCPEDMVNISDAYCIDRYEASRPDATETSYGKDGSRAMSVAGVLPWPIADNQTAELACAASGKRLCTAEEWQNACRGPDSTIYAYGDVYDPSICNGIDTFGRSSFHPTPTGAFPDCTNEWGVYDLNGNFWEHTAAGSDMTVRGGAFNCNDSATLHRCDYIPGNWTPSALGFRCCMIPTDQPGGTDGGVTTGDASSEPARDAAMVDGDGGAGCVPDGGLRDVPAVSDARADQGVDERDGDGPGGDAPAATDGSPREVAADLVPDHASTREVGSATCPPEMALIGAVCVDRYEASRQDATATSAGTDESVAQSKSGVLPWYVNPMSATALDEFQAACQAAGKRLCSSAEWLEACEGPEQNDYVFGNDWDPTLCNSVDTYCQECCETLGLDLTACSTAYPPDYCPTVANCGYSSELTSSYTPETCTISAEYGRDTCHVCYHVMPTGASPRCTSGNGLFDVNGNVWEIVPWEDSRGYQVRGGAFNCGSPRDRFRCAYNASWDELYAGFRCCKDP